MKPVSQNNRFACVLFVCICCLLGASASAAVDHGAFDAILKDVVRDERVDYARVQSAHAGALAGYLDQLAQVDVGGLAGSERLAFYINLYNATMIKAVVDRNPATFKPSDDDFKVFKDPLVRLKDRTVSLNDLENEIIRKEFKEEPRIHAALVCAAVSCPPIIDRAYRAEDLDAVLAENVRRWLADPQRNAVDDSARKLRLSKIFDWYNADFGGPAGVAGWVSKATGRDVSGYKVEFLEYDWSLNAAR